MAEIGLFVRDPKKFANGKMGAEVGRQERGGGENGRKRGGGGRGEGREREEMGLGVYGFGLNYSNI